MAKKGHTSAFNLLRPVTRSEIRTRRLAVQKAVGARIRQFRKKKQASQEHLADSCGLHRSHMGEIERGETNVTIETLLLLANQLEFTISELFHGIA